MCPACIIAISGGLLIANKFGINNLLVIGLATIFLSVITDIILRKINHGKVFFSYQRIIISVVILFITILLAQFLL
ncbi:MAG: hypothetical protein WCT22_03490 [Patescibacteria group bacterium]|jgi:hypothetical protein